MNDCLDQYTRVNVSNFDKVFKILDSQIATAKDLIIAIFVLGFVIPFFISFFACVNQLQRKKSLVEYDSPADFGDVDKSELVGGGDTGESPNEETLDDVNINTIN